MAAGVVTLNSQSYLLLNDDDGGPQSAGVRGSERKQDLTPSTRDVVQGVPGDTDITSGSIIVYGDATGSFGLSDRILAPGDKARPFLSEADTTRMRQITSWVGTATPTNLTTRNLAASIGLGILLVKDGSAFVLLSASATYDYWQWDTATSSYKEVRTGYTIPATMYLGGYTPLYSYGSNTLPWQRATEYAGGSWYAASGGLVNAAAAAAAPVGDANAACTLKYLDMLWSFGITASGITITPYRFSSGSTPATAGAQVQKIDTTPGSATYGTAINSTVTISGEYAIAGVVAGESNVFLVTDKSIYRIGWEDGVNVFTFTQLPCPVPAFTSNPVWWNGELWVGAGNQIIHIIPGQRKPDIVTVDEIGNTPQPFSGRVVQMEASQQYLVAKLVTDLTLGTADTAIVLRNSDGAWINRRLIQANAFTSQGPMFTKLDNNGYALATITSASTTTQWPLLGAGKNPNNLAVLIRSQEGIERIIFPREYGENEASLKQLKRCRLQVKGVGAKTATTHIRAYHQFDHRDVESADALLVNGLGISMTPGGIATGTGEWQVAADAYKTAYGDYGSRITASGNGFVWTEFDNTSAVGSVGITGDAVTAIGVAFAGSGYTSPPDVLITPCPGFAGSGATATATVVGGVVTGFTVTAGGSGYTSGRVYAVCVGGKIDTTSGLVSGSAFSRSTTYNGAGTGVNQAYPYFRSARWMLEIGGDTTGTLVPTFVALSWEFNEYSKVEYQYDLRLRMRVGDTHVKNGTKPDGSDKSLYDTPASIVAARDTLEALKNQHTTFPYTGLDGHTWTAYVTKVSHDTISVDSTGILESESNVVLQIVPLQGTV